MKADKGPAAPASGSPESDIPAFEDLAADPEIGALLDFAPAPRKTKRKDGWTPALQRRFIAFLAWTGSPNKAAQLLGKNRYALDKVYKEEGAEEFRAAWDAAVELFIERDAERIALEHSPRASVRPPSVDGRRKRAIRYSGLQDGQVLNEYGEPEDEDSYRGRTEEASGSIANKLLRIRRLYLREISASPGKRAAFEILTELPVDWEKAERGEPQPDEPFRTSNQRQPDMILTAESGWSFGELGYGPDKKAQLRKAIDEHRADEGLAAVDWDDDPQLARGTDEDRHDGEAGGEEE